MALGAWFPVGAVGVAAVCVAGVALGDIDRHFAWQAWLLATLIVTLRGRRGTCGTGLAPVARLVPVWRRGRRGSFVAGVLGDIDLHFAWQAWHLVTWMCTLRAGVALGDMDHHFAWHVEHDSICLLKLPLILIAAPETCMCSSGDVHRYGRCSGAARLFFSASAVHTHTHAHIHTHT